MDWTESTSDLLVLFPGDVKLQRKLVILPKKYFVRLKLIYSELNTELVDHQNYIVHCADIECISYLE